MWLEEVEDDRVTRFVEMMRSGKTLKPEDFPGGDRSFAPKIEGKKPVDVSLRTKNLVLEPSTAGIYVHVNLWLLFSLTNHHLETAYQGDLLKQAGVHTKI